MRTVVRTSEGLQDHLDLMPRSGAIIDGSGFIGGIQPIAAGNFTFRTSVRLATGQHVCGQGKETRIVWNGGPDDPPLFDIWTYAGHGYVDSPTISDMIIDCPFGGRVIGKNAAAKVIENLQVRNVVIRGGAIVIPDENYHIHLDNVRLIAAGKKMLDISGDLTVINDLKLQGSIGDQTTCAMAIRGHSSWGGYDWNEGYFDCRTVEFHGLNGWHGRHEIASNWGESHFNGVFAYQDNCTVSVPELGNTADWPWMLANGSTLLVREKLNAGAVTCDATSKVYVNGAEQAITPSN